MSHIPYDDDPFRDGSGVDEYFEQNDTFRAALQQIADAGPMFSPDDWRWRVAKDALGGKDPFQQTSEPAFVGLTPEDVDRAYAHYLEIPDTPEQRAYSMGWNDAIARMHGPLDVIDGPEITGVPV